jgi:hypothetical protein
MGTIIPFHPARVRPRPDGQQRPSTLMGSFKEVRYELLALAPRATWSAADWALNTATLHVRLTELYQAILDGKGRYLQGVSSLMERDRERDWECLIQWMAVAEAELEGLILTTTSRPARARSLHRFGEARRQLMIAIDRLEPGPTTDARPIGSSLGRVRQR